MVSGAATGSWTRSTRLRTTSDAFDDDWEAALVHHWRLLPLMRANFVETNPIPVKTALEILGRFDAHFRLPLVRMGEQNRALLEEALRASEVWGGPEGSQ